MKHGLLQATVVAVSLALVFTKFLDCWSTQLRMKSVGDETNPWVRGAMKRFGPRATIWTVFGVVLVIVAVVGTAAYRAAGPWVESGEPPIGRTATVAGYLILGTAIAAIQAAVAHSNLTGRINFIARMILRLNTRPRGR